MYIRLDTVLALDGQTDKQKTLSRCACVGVQIRNKNDKGRNPVLVNQPVI